MIAIDLSKQQARDTDPKTTQKINFTGNLDRAAGATIFSSKRNNFIFFTRNGKSILILFFALIQNDSI